MGELKKVGDGEAGDVESTSLVKSFTLLTYLPYLYTTPISLSPLLPPLPYLPYSPFSISL